MAGANCVGAMPTLLESTAPKACIDVAACKYSFAGAHDLEAHYVRGKVLGSGATATVVEAICRRSGRAVAIKRCDKRGQNADDLERLQAELQIHQGIRHAGIVELQAVYETPTTINIVMERLQGGELLDRLNSQGPFSEAEAAKVALQLLCSLAYLHQRHVVHRDVKLENVMYECDGGSTVKLIDFGLAAQRHNGEKLVGRYGTPKYAAPEVVFGKPHDESADMWSLGVVVYSLLTGQALFHDVQDVGRQMAAGRLKYGRSFSRLSRRAKDFVQCLLNFNCEHRPTAQQAIAHPWLRHAAPKEAAEAQHWVPTGNKIQASPIHSLRRIIFQGFL